MPDEKVQTGHITPEMIRETMDRMNKGEIHRPQWIVSPEMYELIKKDFNGE